MKIIGIDLGGEYGKGTTSICECEYKDKLFIEKDIFDGDRNEIQEKAKNRAFELIEKIIWKFFQKNKKIKAG